jgi:hypothetical protein
LALPAPKLNQPTWSMRPPSTCPPHGGNDGQSCITLGVYFCSGSLYKVYRSRGECFICRRGWGFRRVPTLPTVDHITVLEESRGWASVVLVKAPVALSYLPSTNHGVPGGGGGAVILDGSEWQRQQCCVNPSGMAANGRQWQCASRMTASPWAPEGKAASAASASVGWHASPWARAF